MFQGAIVALVTPFKNGAIDEEGYRELIEFQIENGTSAIVPCGTTGESATLSFEEHHRVVEICIDAVNGRVPVIAGTGGNSTQEAIELTKHAKKAGADACLQVTPYYNKPTQEGLYLHFKHIAKEAGLPMVLYNIPGRTGVNMLPETVARLAELEEVVAIKEASGSISQIIEVILCVGDRVAVLSGDDNLTLPIMAVGGKGVISVVSNIVPRMVSDLCASYLKGDVEGARKQFLYLYPLCQAMFYETNPIPVKTALSMMGKISDELRLPLSSMSPANREKLRNVLIEYGII
jgi:4-hydroxy-tetrahydrodipicolinate synthase